VKKSHMLRAGVKPGWIVRRGTGKAEVFPPTQVLGRDETFVVQNLTKDAALVSFGPGVLVPRARRIGPGRRGSFQVDPRAVAGFYEYDVTLPALKQYAEGGSKPSVIIDG
jgi:hypothetical protein